MGENTPHDVAASIGSPIDDPESTMAGLAAGPLPSGSGLTILVVDDDPVIRTLVARTLTLARFDVVTAPGSREALRLVAEGRVLPVVLVTDIEMPEMNGVELAARLLALRPALRVVMMTGDPERAESARHHPSIVDSVLLKPMPLDDLVRAVSSAADQTRAR